MLYWFGFFLMIRFVSSAKVEIQLRDVHPFDFTCYAELQSREVQAGLDSLYFVVIINPEAQRVPLELPPLQIPGLSMFVFLCVSDRLLEQADFRGQNPKASSILLEKKSSLFAAGGRRISTACSEFFQVH